MSSSVEFYTFESMDNVVIHSVSSEATNHPSEHAVAPLEPDFAWEANEASAQHWIVLDLTYPYEIDAVVWMHREVETSPDIGVSIKTIQYSHDATTWYTATTGVVSPITNKLIKVVDLSPINVKARYWKFTFQGQASPSYYCPTDMRVSMLWLATRHGLTNSGAMPYNDTVVVPYGEKKLLFGGRFTMGYSVNHSVVFDRKFQLLQADYDSVMDITSACNGKYRPFVYKESGNDYRLCKFTSDSVDEQKLDEGAWRLSLSMVELPIVGMDEVY